MISFKSFDLKNTARHDYKFNSIDAMLIMRKWVIFMDTSFQPWYWLGKQEQEIRSYFSSSMSVNVQYSLNKANLLAFYICVSCWEIDVFMQNILLIIHTQLSDFLQNDKYGQQQRGEINIMVKHIHLTNKVARYCIPSTGNRTVVCISMLLLSIMSAAKAISRGEI